MIAVNAPPFSETVVDGETGFLYRDPRQYAGADFGRQLPSKGDIDLDPVIVKKPVMKRSTVEDRKGRRVVVQRSGSEETRARKEAKAMFGGPPKPAKRGYKGKRDIKPRDE